MIVNRNIVLKRVGNKILLPIIGHEGIDAPPNIPAVTFLMCRTVGYDLNSGKLDLKLLTDIVNERMYHIAIEENSELFSEHNIKSLTFSKHFSHLPLLDARFNNDLKFNKRTSIHNEYIEPKQFSESKIIEKNPAALLSANLVLQIPVKELQFTDGNVSLEYYIPHISRKVTFDIKNSFIKKEHDSIKNYFPKALKIDKFSISIQFEYLDGKLLRSESTSPAIALIDEALFEIVEDLCIKDNVINRSDDEIYDIGELSFELAKRIGSEKIQDIQWLLNKLIAKERTKHYYHLRYLSDKHQSDMFNLKLTGRPLSFIFLLPVQNGYCLIWETYSTEEATYVWRLNSKDSQLRIDIQNHVDLIKQLRQNNKIAYLKTKPENFIKIEHDYFGEDFGFKKWRSKLENFLLKDVC